MKKISLEKAVNDSGFKKSFIAEKLGISPCYFSAFIKKPKDMSLEQAYILCTLLNKNMEDLDFGVDGFFYPKT